MVVNARDLEHVLFRMFLQSGCDATSSEFKDRAASIELVGQSESEIVKALTRLHDMVADWRKRRH
jgi:hypothetical protein